MTGGPGPTKAPRPRRGAFDWPLVPWTLTALLGAGILLLDVLGAPISLRVQLAGLLAVGVGVVGGVVVDTWVRRRS